MSEMRPQSRQVAIVYRIYPRVAQPALGLPFGDDKLQLSEICLRSFKESLGDLRVKIWVLLDGCPKEYADLFLRYFSSEDLVLIPLPGLGNCATFAKQIEILLEQRESEFVYFAEDDYVYLSEQFQSMIEFLQTHEDVHFVSPYDHLDCYTLELHRQPKWLKAHGGRHWRTANSTCLTFLTTRETLARTQSVFRQYKRKSLDCSLWLSLTKRRVFDPLFWGRSFFRDRRACKALLKSWLYCWPQILFGKRWALWVPIPGIATHLDSNLLSPNVDWVAIMKEMAKQDFEVANTVSLGQR